MNRYIYLLIVFLLGISDLLPGGLKIMPRAMNYVSDLFGMVMWLAIALRLIDRRKANIAPKYLGLIAVYVIVIITSVIINWVRVEPLIVGIRFHLKYLPFFLFPMVFEFSGEEVKKQLKLIVPFLLLQLPMVLFQRFVWLRHHHADFFTGTLGQTSHLSIFLVCSIAVVYAFHLRGYLSLRQFLVVAGWLFLPTTLNETKSVLVLFPLAFVLPAFFLPRRWPSNKVKNLFTVAVVVLVLGSVFAVVFQQVEGYSVLEHYEKEMEGKGYTFTGSQGILGEKKIGRGDAIAMAFRDLSRDIGGLLFGLGAGNVIPIGTKSFRGDYVTAKLPYKGDLLYMTHVLWELGVVGVLTYSTFFFLIFTDAVFLTKASDIYGALSLGFTGVVGIMSIAFLYKNIIYFPALYVLFWFFSGVIAARAHKIRGLADACAGIRTDMLGLQQGAMSEGLRRPAHWSSHQA